jgi:hypothetical protein
MRLYGWQVRGGTVLITAGATYAQMPERPATRLVLNFIFACDLCAKRISTALWHGREERALATVHSESPDGAQSVFYPGRANAMSPEMGGCLQSTYRFHTERPGGEGSDHSRRRKGLLDPRSSRHADRRRNTRAQRKGASQFHAGLRFVRVDSLFSRARRSRLGHLTMAHPEIWSEDVAEFMRRLGDDALQNSNAN